MKISKKLFAGTVLALLSALFIVAAAVHAQSTAPATTKKTTATKKPVAALVPTNYPVGEIVATIPAGCAVPVVNGITYYLCGNTWFQPSYGANVVLSRGDNALKFCALEYFCSY